MSEGEQIKLELVKKFLESPLRPLAYKMSILNPSGTFLKKCTLMFLKAGFTTIEIVRGKLGTTIEADRIKAINS